MSSETDETVDSPEGAVRASNGRAGSRDESRASASDSSGRWRKKAVEAALQRVGVKNLTGRFAKSLAGVSGLKVLKMGLGFVIGVVLARLLDPSGYGLFKYVLSWMGMLGILVVFGLDKLLVREVATYGSRGAWPRLRGLLRRADQFLLLLSFSLGVVGVLAVWSFARLESEHAIYVFGLAFFLLPLRGLLYLRRSALQGLNHVVLGRLPETAIRPAVFLAIVGGLVLWLGVGGLTSVWAMAAEVTAVGLSLAVGAALLRRKTPSPVREAAPIYENSTWIRSALPMMLIAVMYVINGRTDILMLGILADAQDVGIYAVARQGASVVVFVLLAVNQVVAPEFARLYEGRQMKQLQKLVTSSSRVILVLSLPVAFALTAFGHWFLLIFGPEFVAGGDALRILCIGRLFSAAAGSVGFLLMMSNHERIAAINVGISSVVNIFLNTVLIPRFGIEGAAAATATSFALVNVLQAWAVYRTMNLRPTAF